jgi:hypothetical protein
MKRKLSTIFLLAILLTVAGCKKCYYCHNNCKVCQDTHFYILVQSDILSAQYYKVYTDSLTGLGWSCRDTTPNKDMQVCGQSGNQVNGTIAQDEQAGYTCSAIAN